MLLQNKTVAIVGGGPGGLTLARLLQINGVTVQVFERDVNKDARMVGSPLDMHEDSGLAAIRKAGLMEAFKQNFRPGADRMLIVNDQAEVLFSDHETHPLENFGHEHFRPEIDRGPLRNMLLNSLQPGTVIWDSHFISMQQQDDGWLLVFKNAHTAYADIVIAADGANSKIRPYITPIKPFYSGIMMLEGNVQDAEKATPAIHSLANGGKIMAFGNEKNILLGQKGNGDLGFYASFKAAEDWAKKSGLNFTDTKEMVNWFTSAYPEWSNEWIELFEKASVPFIPRSIYCMPLDQNWETVSNLTMIGDAAHVMPPFAGEGANMAMLDALALSECLCGGNYQTIKEAMAAYEIDMRKRASAAAQESLENGERMHHVNALQTMMEFFNGHSDEN